MRDALTWYVVVQVAGLAIWPLVARALAPLDDRGWAVSKAAGGLGVAWSRATDAQESELRPHDAPSMTFGVGG